MRAYKMASTGSELANEGKTTLAAMGVALAITTGDPVRIVRSVGGLIGQIWADVNLGMYWTPYVEVPGLGDVYSLPALVQTGDTLCMFYQGSDSTLYMGYETTIPSIVYPPQVLPGSVALNTTTGPTAVMFNGSLYVFYGGTSGDGFMQLFYNVFDGTSWGPATLVVNHAALVSGTMAAPIALTDPITNQQTLYLIYVSPGVEANTYQLGYSWSPTGTANTWTTANGALPISNYAVGSSPSVVSCAWTSAYEGEGSTQNYANIFFGSLLPDAGAACPAFYAALLGFDSSGLPGIVPYSSFDDYIVPNTSMSGSPFAVICTPDSTTNLMTTVVHQGGQQNGQIWYNWINSENEWNGDTQVPNAVTSPSGSPTAAVFAPEAFFDQMAEASDLYFCFPDQAGNALLVGSVSQFNTGEAPSQAVNCPAGSTLAGNFLLPVSFSDTQTPQPWVFYQVVNPPSTDVATASTTPPSTLYYSVFTETGWVQNVVPTTLAASTIAPTGSPTSAVASTNVPCLVSRTTADQLAFSYYSQFYNAWSSPIPIPGLASDEGSPSLVTFNNLLYLLYIQLGSIWCCTSSNGGLNWSASTAVPSESTTTGLTSLVFGDALYVLSSANEDTSGMSQLWCTCLSGAPAQWGSPTQVVPAGCSASVGILSGAPAACTYTDNQGTELLTIFYAGAGSANNWPLAGCTLMASGAWTQFSMPDVLIAAPPSTYSTGDTLNIFYQAAASPGQLSYLVYDGFTWAATGTLPVTGMTGSTANIRLQPSGNVGPSLFLFYNSSNASGSETSYCQCTFPVRMEKVEAVSPAMGMSGAPTATVLNDTIWVFYQPDPGDGGVSYQYCSAPLAPTLADPQPSWTPSWTEPAVIPIPMAPGYSDYSNNPSAVTFNSSVYVFNFGFDGLTCSSFAENASTWNIVTIEIDGVPIYNPQTSDGIGYSTSAVVCNGALYVFYPTPTDPGPFAGPPQYLNWITSTDGVNWSACPSPYISTLSDCVPAIVLNDVIYLFYQAENGGFYYTPFSATEAALPIEIGLLEMSSGPCIVPFNDCLWALTQGGSIDNKILGKAQDLADVTAVTNGNQQVWYAINASPSGSLWSWNTLLADTVIDASTIPAGTVYPPEELASSEPSVSALYAFYQNNGQISYKQTTGGYQNWTAAQTLNEAGMTADTAYASCSPSAVCFPLSAAAELWLFFQGANNSGLLWYTKYSTAVGWSAPLQIVPTGCTSSTAIMAQSPSAVVYPLPEYASASVPSQLYVFYGVSAGDACPGQALLRYSVSADGYAWSQTEVTVSYFWPAQPQVPLPAQTMEGFLQQTSPSAVVFNNTLYVFYTSGYGPCVITGTGADTNSYFAYSTFDGSNWSAINFPDINGGQPDSGYMYFISTCVLNGVLFAYFQNNLDPTAIWSTHTFDGRTWTTAAPVVQSQLITSGTAMQVSQTANSIYGGMLGGTAEYGDVPIKLSLS
ncbi:hypothetical protein [Pseudomonas sp. NPDC086251]|uniref:hypothetical protein n=1 Tax=Pseudomonas sp. NPDC086251 TaxID=3364431 RepID=UPI003837F72B